MWVIYAGIIAGIIVLLLISRSTKADADADMPAPCRLFLKPAAWLEERLLRLRQHLKWKGTGIEAAAEGGYGNPVSP